MTPDLYNETDQSDLYGIFPIFALRHNVPSFCFFFFFFTQPPSFYLFVVFVFSSLFYYYFNFVYSGRNDL